MEERISNLEETLNKFIKESQIRQKESENIVWGIKKTYDQTFKTQASSIKKIEIHLGRIAKIIQDKETGSLPSSTETNLRGLANAITTSSGLNYKPLKNPLENITTSQEKLATKETTIKSGEKGPDNPKKSALEQMAKYAKFIKDLLTRKRRTEETSKITLNERCSAVLLNKIPFKEKDHGSFTIPCVIGKMGIDKALADVGASISLMPYSMGIAENAIVKIDKFIFPVDFIVLDMKEDHKIPIILGRPFLATTHTMIDVFNKKIYFEVGNETITFDIEKSMKFSTPEDDKCLFTDTVDKEPVRPTLFATNTIKAEKQPAKLKELPSHLEYAFLNNNQEFPVIISSLLNSQEKESLLKVLKQHKAALAWKVVDIKGINP
ncbi:putative nucleotidyltransferase, ribonuclease H [Tanacetum coccineum]